MYTELAICPNCGSSLHSGFLSNNKLLQSADTVFINSVNQTDNAGYCTKCGDALYTEATTKFAAQLNETRQLIYKLMGCIPVVFIQNPLGWEYEVLSMVTGQSTTGTGVFSEFAASMTDLFGMQSGRYNAKLKAGEEMCFAQLRKQTIQLGGNAVIATDIDYSEVGGDKGMLMVCMAGTAVKVKNPVRLGQEKLDDLDEISRLWERLKVLDNLNKSAR